MGGALLNSGDVGTQGHWKAAIFQLATDVCRNTRYVTTNELNSL
jgi:hypothetical protein